jgi:hypothetical protein
VASKHGDLEELGGWVPKVVGYRSRGVHIVERHELLPGGEPVPGQSYAPTVDVFRFRGTSPFVRY